MAEFLSIADLDGTGRIFLVLKVAMDESFNNRTMCVGGWMLSQQFWPRLERAWLQRVELDSRRAVKCGLKPLSRYHATDCQNYKRDYEGWDDDRQIKHTKKLIEIIAYNRRHIWGVAVGISLQELRTAFPEVKETRILWEAYRLCISECFARIGDMVAQYFPRERVEIIVERGKLKSAARAAFDDLAETSIYPNSRYFVSLRDMTWQDCPALQPADFIAFEGFKQADLHKRGKFDMRRSLQKVMGEDIPIMAGYYTGDALIGLARLGLRMSPLSLKSK